MSLPGVVADFHDVGRDVSEVAGYAVFRNGENLILKTVLRLYFCEPDAKLVILQS